MLSCEDNTLIYGDNIDVMQALLDQGYRGAFDMIYFDGPFNSGLIFSNPNPSLGHETVDPWAEKETLQQYLDSEYYVANYRKRMELARELLNDHSIFVIQANQLEVHHLKVLLDEIFGRSRFIIEVIWKHSNEPWGRPEGGSHFGYQHETLLFYSKTGEHLFIPDQIFPSVWDDLGGYSDLGVENTRFPSQKPERLLEQVLSISTSENALVGDFYCGSGTLPAVASRMGRRWVACEQSLPALNIARARLDRYESKYAFCTLVDEVNRSWLKENRYMKESRIPFTSEEARELLSLTKGQITDVYAYSYTDNVDRILDEYAVRAHVWLPQISSGGISFETLTSLPRPKPAASGDGEYSLEVADPVRWLLHHLVHVKKNRLGLVELEQTSDGCRYMTDWSELLANASQGLALIDNHWIASIQACGDYVLLTDVLGYSYSVSTV